MIIDSSFNDTGAGDQRSAQRLPARHALYTTPRPCPFFDTHPTLFTPVSPVHFHRIGERRRIP
jgi:hypothetical protein